MEQQETSNDAKLSKPDSDIMQVALKQSGCTADEAIMFGDTPYDIESAEKVGVKTIAFRSGGWNDQDLTQAIAIYTDPADLLAHYDLSPLAKGLPQ